MTVASPESVSLQSKGIHISIALRVMNLKIMTHTIITVIVRKTGTVSFHNSVIGS